MGFLHLFRDFPYQRSNTIDKKTTIILFLCSIIYENESFKIYKNLTLVIQTNSAIFDRRKNNITLL